MNRESPMEEQILSKDLPCQKQYIQSLYETYKRKSFIPSYEIKYEIGNVTQKLHQQKQRVIQQLKQQSILAQTISEQDLTNYYLKKQQYKNNLFGIHIIQKIKDIYTFINNHLKSHGYHSINGGNQTQLFGKELESFSKLIKMIEDLQLYLSQSSTGPLRQQKSRKQSSSSTSQFILKLYTNIYKVVIQNKDVLQNQFILQEILKKYNLPFKRNKTEKQFSKLIIDQKDQIFVRSFLHRQACEYALANFLSSITDSQNQFKYNSGFFNTYNKKINDSIQYIFIQKHQSHNILQPNWMFEYIQETFNINYQIFKDYFLSKISNQSQGNILIYILQYSVQNLFYQNIKSRLQGDLKAVDSAKNSFFYFKFIDTLHQLEEKLSITFSQQISLLQRILIEFQTRKSLLILEKSFDYEHKWIEQKIFKDFWEAINYSNIDLKNIQAYNIVTNFNVLFEKLYTKFSSIYDQELVKKINRFYQETVRNLAAHIKTSFERIYNHSGLDKLNIILTFKRVDNQFKAGLSGFISKDLQFQKQIKKEYYDYILSLFNVYALQELSIHHKRLLKGTTQCEKYFVQQQVSEQEYIQITQKSQKIFKNWQKNLQQLNKVYSYRDGKVKNQFFTFLESFDFTEKGITLFLEFYEPFLKLYYSFQAYNVFKMVILMDKKEQLEYLKIHNNLLNFLLESQLRAIRNLKIR